MDTAAAPITVVQALFTPQDFTSVLVSLQSHAEEIVPRLPERVDARDILATAASLESLADRTKQTLEQVLKFLPNVEATLLPASYQAALRDVDAAAESAATPGDLIKALVALRDNKLHESMPGFAAGVRAAADMLTDALGTAHGRALGPNSPTAVAKACAHGAVAGGMAGALSGSGPIVGAIVGGIAGSARASLTKG